LREIALSDDDAVVGGSQRELWWAGQEKCGAIENAGSRMRFSVDQAAQTIIMEISEISNSTKVSNLANK
jgi:hypothetical protein